MCLKWTVGLCPSLFAHELMTLLFSKELNQSTLWRVSMKQEKKVISRSSSKLRFQIPSYGLYFLLLYYSRLILFIHPVNFLKGSSCPLKSSSSCTRSNMPPSRKHECFFVPKHNSNFFFFFFSILIQSQIKPSGLDFNSHHSLTVHKRGLNLDMGISIQIISHLGLNFNWIEFQFQFQVCFYLELWCAPETESELLAENYLKQDRRLSNL